MLAQNTSPKKYFKLSCYNREIHIYIEKLQGDGDSATQAIRNRHCHFRRRI